MYTVFFDSGLGGLNPLKEAIRLLPGENFIYYGDTANVPYGLKSEEQIKSLLAEIVESLSPLGLKAFVLACNTATCAAAAFLRAGCQIPIIGMEPAIKPAVESAAPRGKRVFLLATNRTLKTEKFRKLKERVDPDNLVDCLPGPELVERVEALNFDQAGAADLLRQKLAGFNLNDYGCVVLGSTHFGYFKKALQNVFPAGVEIIDGDAGTVRHLAELLGLEPGRAEEGAGEILLHLSDQKDAAKIKAVTEMLEQAAPGRVKLFTPARPLKK